MLNPWKFQVLISKPMISSLKHKTDLSCFLLSVWEKRWLLSIKYILLKKAQEDTSHKFFSFVRPWSKALHLVIRAFTWVFGERTRRKHGRHQVLWLMSLTKLTHCYQSEPAEMVPFAELCCGTMCPDNVCHFHPDLTIMRTFCTFKWGLTVDH